MRCISTTLYDLDPKEWALLISPASSVFSKFGDGLDIYHPLAYLEGLLLLSAIDIQQHRKHGSRKDEIVVPVY